MLLLGIDLGTSSIKVAVIEAASQLVLASAQYPEVEADIISLHPGWAEQGPDQWWENIKQAIVKCHTSGSYNPLDIAAIGIAYQMHGLVLVDRDQHVLRNSIIWCDSRAVEQGNRAYAAIGENKCLTHLLNSPGNFTASKLAWVKENEPALYERIHKAMLPGDFVAMKLTGDITTSVSAMSEGIFWDFRGNELSGDVLSYFGFDRQLFPDIRPLFSPHGHLKQQVAERLSLKPGIPVSYKAGDQPNNALALNVLQPGEVAATAGTSGVIYGVSDELRFDGQSRINGFAHVNHGEMGNNGPDTRIGILLCINGAGIFNRWVRSITGSNHSYDALNELASAVPEGAEGLIALPFGNGAERMLNNKIPGAHFLHLDLNKHNAGHFVRAVQEGIVCAFRYGLDIMRENGISPSVIRAAHTNLFRSRLFTQTFCDINNVAVEFYDGDGSIGAAIGAGIGAGIYASAAEGSSLRKPSDTIEPSGSRNTEELYAAWLTELETRMKNLPH